MSCNALSALGIDELLGLEEAGRDRLTDSDYKEKGAKIHQLGWEFNIIIMHFGIIKVSKEVILRNSR